jgi:hypothetical protein
MFTPLTLKLFQITSKQKQAIRLITNKIDKSNNSNNKTHENSEYIFSS